jgi:hypothetical protein
MKITLDLPEETLRLIETALMNTIIAGETQAERNLCLGIQTIWPTAEDDITRLDALLEQMRQAIYTATNRADTNGRIGAWRPGTCFGCNAVGQVYVDLLAEHPGDEGHECCRKCCNELWHNMACADNYEPRVDAPYHEQ